METSVDNNQSITPLQIVCEGVSFVVLGGKKVLVCGDWPDKCPVGSGQLQSKFSMTVKYKVWPKRYTGDCIKMIVNDQTVE